MSFQEKTFKEKKIFYKERQKFFDAVNAVRNGEEPTIKYKGEIYRLFPESWDYIEEKRYGKCVIFSKRYKSHTITDWWFSNRNGFRWGSERGKDVKGDGKRVLCFAEKIESNN